MRKKQKFTLSNTKIFLLSTLILIVGIFMLFFSIFFAPSQNQSETVLENIVQAKEEVKKDEVKYTETEKTEHKQETKTETKNISSTKPTEQKTQSSTKSEQPKSTQNQQTTKTEPQKEHAITTGVTQKKSGKLVFVFDDAGHNMTQLKPFLSMPFPITVAILPKLAHSKEAALALRNAGVCSILHQPMQAVNLSVDPGLGAIKPEMYSYEIEAIVKENLAEIGSVVGMNNHEGSLITASQRDIGTVLDVCKERNLIFLDSRTNAESKAKQAALERGMTILERDIFLDNIQDKAEIIAMVNKGLEIADKKGYAIMIGHVWCKDLAAILTELYPNLKAQGYTFLTLEELYNQLTN